MRRVVPMSGFVVLLFLLGVESAVGQEDVLEKGLNCALCHGTEDFWADDRKHLYVNLEDLAVDAHWAKGIACHDCHGGDPNSTDLGEAHSPDNDFRTLEKPQDEPAFCGRCHSDASYMERFSPDAKTDLVDQFWTSAHGRHLSELGEEQAGETETQAVSCTSCHKKHGMRPTADPLSTSHPSQLMETCGSCHQTQRDQLLVDAHSKAGPADDQGAPTVLSCAECHSEPVHSMLPVDDLASSVFMQNQVTSCGKCHEESLDEYQLSVHGRGLAESGLVSTAVCSSCHGAHGVFTSADNRSMLHAPNVATTCGKCHLFIEQRLLASVHGRGNGPGELLQADGDAEQAGWDEGQRRPTCISCHEGHDLPSPKSGEARMMMADNCGSCHSDLSERYMISIHGQLTQLGLTTAAKCSDCHGAHDILPIDDPHSRVAVGANRVETCQQCHPGANLNFASFDVHADHRDPGSSASLHYAFVAMEVLLFSVFGFFGIHTLLWFFRSLVHRFRHGIPGRIKAGKKAYRRFDTIHRIVHGLIIVSFLGLALTGLPLKYSNTDWARSLAAALGGFENTSFWHRVCAIITFAYFAIHLKWLLQKILECRQANMGWKEILFGPDSPVPNTQDFKDIFAMFRWFVGLGPKPTFDRWSYWEKFDYWAVFWGVGIIGTTGLALWFPETFCLVFSGALLNIAKVIHSEEALLATGFIFTIHFFNTHLRAEKFPMDMSMLTGMVTEEELKDERPEFMERMQEQGKLEQLEDVAPPSGQIFASTLVGTLALVIGLALLAGIVAGILF